MVAIVARWIRIISVYVGVCTFAALFVTGCNQTGEAGRCDANLPTRDKWKVPAYPNAKQISSAESPSYWQLTTIFQTVDSPAKVHDFYKSTLEKAGWQPNTRAGDGSLIVANCCYYLHLDVSTEVTDEGLTNIIIKYNSSMGCG
jgi:hypothetical protein